MTVKNKRRFSNNANLVFSISNGPNEQTSVLTRRSSGHQLVLRTHETEYAPAKKGFSIKFSGAKLHFQWCINSVIISWTIVDINYLSFLFLEQQTRSVVLKMGIVADFILTLNVINLKPNNYRNV